MNKENLNIYYLRVSVLIAVLELQVFGGVILCLLVSSYRHYRRSGLDYLEDKMIHRNVVNFRWSQNR